ncbi:MAG: hypothetical protein WCF85_19245, partial [Rhodospirillaceae bacterium]
LLFGYAPLQAGDTATGSATPAVDPAPPASERKAAPPVTSDHGPATSTISTTTQLQCTGCTPVTKPYMKRGAVILKYREDNNGELPPTLARLSGAEIDTLLRGKSWSSAIIAAPDGMEYQRLLAFDADNRGRWLNFAGGPKQYSTMCRFEIEEDMLCLRCNEGQAQCSIIYRDTESKDLYVAHDPEKGRIELYDWIQDSRWESDRFLAPH